ncbi:hypothetical protein HY224_00130 [Candidatus Uhrbacteria bacterium]|nr:hypothetical protein [Candidatus Uhrbacteria bacterium]
MLSEPKCQNCQSQFKIAQEDFEFYKKIQVPPPTFCPDCRLQRRYAFRNERALYKDVCDLCGKQMISAYSPDKPFKVYCRECWYSDKWDGLDYGMDYDFSKPFFPQWHELEKRVPRMGLLSIGSSVNSDFANYVWNVKDVYMSYSTINSESVIFSKSVDKSKDMADCFAVKDSEKCYECMDGANNFNCAFLLLSRNCLDSKFLFDCVNSQSCFMSSNLRSKQFVFRNKQLTADQYQKEVAKVNFGDHDVLSQLKSEFKKLWSESLHQYANAAKTTNSIGDNMENVKESQYVFESYDVENSKFLVRLIGVKDCYDLTHSGNSQLVYEGVAGMNNAYNIRMCSQCPDTTEAIYSDWCLNCSNIFGCDGLRKKEYCILNRQYSKEDYFALCDKIMSQMDSLPFKDRGGRVYKFGEFFPIELSPFTYNEAVVNEYFPLTKDQALASGYSWHDPDEAAYKPTMKAEDLPKDIKDASDSLLKEVISCGSCHKAFKIIARELAFLRQQGLTLPRKCPNCRHADRLAMRLYRANVPIAGTPIGWPCATLLSCGIVTVCVRALSLKHLLVSPGKTGRNMRMVRRSAPINLKLLLRQNAPK